MPLHQNTQISTQKLFRYITKEKQDVGSIYIYAILSGLVQLSIPLGVQAIISYVMGATMVTSLYLLIAFVVLGTFLAGFFRIRVMQIIEKIQQKIFVEYALAFAEKLPKVNLTATRKYYLPERVNRFFDVQILQKAISKLLLEIPTALIQIIFGILLLSFYHPWFLVFGALMLLIVILIFKVTMSSGIQSSLEESERKYEVASWLEDIAHAVKTFKINSKENTHVKGSDDRVVNYLTHRTKHFKVLLYQYWAIVVFKVLITLIVLAIGTYLLINQELNIGAFIATEIVVLTILTSVEKLIKSLESYYDVITSLSKLSTVTDLVEERTSDLELSPAGDGVEIVFSDVSFRFADQKPILSNLNFKIPKNSLCVINGRLGAGKSLLLNILAGFYEPSDGSILFDKVSVRNLDKDAFRKLTGIYLDDLTIIKATLLENITVGKEDVHTNDIMKLLEAWGIEDFTTQFTEGLYTPLSETDTELSFSSRKKILLLRAMLGPKKLLLLEDPVEGMNEDFAKRFMEYIHTIKKHTTVVIVTQNRELAKQADVVLTLNQGTVMREDL
ncbi:MAG TPA: ATP-binding cassette domain-containing protein [Ferruginibacter sp.]|nr:ATP-binding cassette domain-containing protein [Ferruginibacter sp.]HRO05442.1 ATP-binding cassette domain-containing protein [Ferruginibacter sp.]HRO96158.1 ATP-binding cassette domain-containing protein [Ferruginibacter sp.]HRP48919.1 ATP-binding cassette domain-containing protein [Ferruginibacter sp.]